MDSTLSLQSNLYPKITPAGAYYAVSSNVPSASRTVRPWSACASATAWARSLSDAGVGTSAS
ncbi:MAG TPA: hypothetical protein PL031_10095, partial [Neisseria sp.]|nr:hypothetical protein [Neisseria sp.]